MTTYIVQWDYASSYGGPWSKGDRVELDDATAEAINRDSPGVLVAIPAKTPEPSEPLPGAADRQVKTASKRAAGKD